MTFNIGNVVGWPSKKDPSLEWIVAEVWDDELLTLVSLSLANRCVNVPVTEVEFLASCVTKHIMQIAGVGSKS